MHSHTSPFVEWTHETFSFYKSGNWRLYLFFSFLEKRNWPVASGTLQVALGCCEAPLFRPSPEPHPAVGGAGFCWFPHQSLGVSRVGLLSPQKILWPISYCRVYGCWWSLGDFCLLLEPKELSGNIHSFHGPKSWGTERWGHFEQNWFLNFCFQARIYPIILK